jgi:uncharacterized membrane protein YvbJ
MSKFCPFCGEELVDGAKFCKSCGKSLEDFQNLDDDQNDYQFTPPVVENDYTLIFVAGIIFALLIPIIGLIIGVYLYTRKNSSKAKSRGMIVIGLSAVVWIISLIVTFLL